MKYLYGDATPFPLEENFIDTLIAATNTCVMLFECDGVVEDRRRQARAVRDRVDEELNRMLVVQRSVEAAIGPILPTGDPKYVAEATARQIADSARALIETARANLTARRNAAIQSRPVDDRLAGQMRETLERFLLAHELPRTKWRICWGGGTQPGEAELVLASESPRELHAGFGAALPEGHMWSGPVSIADLVPGLPLVLQRSTKRLGRKRTSKELVTRYLITGVEVSPKHAAFIVKRNPKKSAAGYEVVMRSGERANPVIFPLDDTGEREDALSLSGDNAVALSQLWNEIDKAMRGLVAHRSALVSVKLRGAELAEVDSPAAVAEALLMSIAPIVREMRVRSKVPGELVLKRELGDGKREELFVPRQKLHDKFARLPYKYQAPFEAAGLGSEATREFVTRTSTSADTHQHEIADEDEDDEVEGAQTLPASPKTPPLATAPAA